MKSASENATIARNYRIEIVVNTIDYEARRGVTEVWVSESKWAEGLEQQLEEKGYKVNYYPGCSSYRINWSHA